MTETNPEKDCVSTRPWSEVLNRSLKLFMFNAAQEGGRSFGRILFYVVLAALALALLTFAIDSVTGLFSGWFDFWPFSGSGAEVEAEKAGWFGRGHAADPAPVPKADGAGGAEKWYCRYNPIC